MFYLRSFPNCGAFMTALDSPSESDDELEDDVSDGIFKAVVEPDAFFTTVDSESESSEL